MRVWRKTSEGIFEPEGPLNGRVYIRRVDPSPYPKYWDAVQIKAENGWRAGKALGWSERFEDVSNRVTRWFEFYDGKGAS